MKSQPNFKTFVILVFAIGFALHLIWEYWQCTAFFVHVKVPPTTGAMLTATLGDVIILWISYSFVALWKKSFSWPYHSHGLMSWILMVVISAAISCTFEYFATIRQLWAYTPLNPTMFGISVIPILQMAILNPTSVLLSKALSNLQGRPQ